MNNSLNEYLRFNFELNIELNHFLARFNVKMNNQNVSPTPMLHAVITEVSLFHFLNDSDKKGENCNYYFAETGGD